MSTQLRIYEVKDGKLEGWLDCWRTKIVPLREKFGFRIDGNWTVAGSSQFAYLISYDGPEDFTTKNQEYWSSPDRAALGVDPDEYLGSTQNFPLEPI